MRYKFVELAEPDAPGLEHVVNEWVDRGWALEAIRFAPDGRAFVSFVREHGKRIDLGEIDLGEAPHVPIELDHASAKRVRKKKRK